MEKDSNTISRYRANFQAEVDGAAVYRELAKNTSKTELSTVFGRLAAIETKHADFWQEQLARTGCSLNLKPSRKARLLGWLARRFGAEAVVPIVTGNECRACHDYDDQPEATAQGFDREERSHARVLRELVGGAGLSGPSIALLEGRRVGGGGNTLRAAVLGANDGLVSNTSLVMGVAGASAHSSIILLAGVAGLLAGACSMAMGEWLSVTSAREFYRQQMAIESKELEAAPEEEQEELTLIYQSKGIDESSARRLAARIMAKPKQATDALAREELGIDPEDLGGSAVAAAASSFMLFAVGAIIPVWPFAMLSGPSATLASLVSSGLGLLLIGAGTSLFTGRSVIFSAARQLLIGMLAAAVTYGAGSLFGVTLD